MTAPVERLGRRVVAARSSRVAPELSARWAQIPDWVDDDWAERVARFRATVIPWLDATRPLRGQRILEIGTGPGASTVGLAEQGAEVVGIDLAAVHLRHADRVLGELGLPVRVEVRNAVDLGEVVAPDGVDQIIFWAVLEHMTIDERLAALATAWQLLPSGGLLTLVETPNRLWPLDSHTSYLPYFSWLPYDLGYRYSTFSPRDDIREAYGGPDAENMAHFLRRGHGVSFHEFDLAIGDHREVLVASWMQDYWRRRSPSRRLGWALSSAGRTERVLRSFSSGSNRAWFQPFLYLSLKKPSE